MRSFNKYYLNNYKQKIYNTDITKRSNFINDQLISISGIKIILKLLNPTKITFLFSTSRLNQKSLNNVLNSNIATNPTARQFVQSFKKCCLQYFKHSIGATVQKTSIKYLFISGQAITNKITRLFASVEQNHIFYFSNE